MTPLSEQRVTEAAGNYPDPARPRSGVVARSRAVFLCPKRLEPVHAIERIRLKIVGVTERVGGLGVHPPISPR